MDRALPNALVSGHELRITEIGSLPDADDRHVLAAAVHCGAQYIVTSNLRDFPATLLRKHGVEARTPDGFVEMLLNADAETVTSVLERDRRGLHVPAMNIAQYREALARNHLEGIAKRLVPQEGLSEIE